jgi:hypothetical protein
MIRGGGHLFEYMGWKITAKTAASRVPASSEGNGGTSLQLCK